ncbi:hypothetical protein [Silanimonas sp.]|uniref:hypothetical protein n=1 Tax=Silanimonas sp. TaxID=1929290 RepID=UPI00260CE301|nr:hypothetical protein [Silanimonas sp.]
MLKPALIALLLAATSVVAHAAERTVYRGILEGAGEIVMELQVASDPQAAAAGEWEGRYFYPKRGVDIPLAGPPGALVEPRPLNALSDTERQAIGDWTKGAFEHPAARFEGHVVDGEYAGRWMPTGGGRARAFRLHEVARYDPEAASPRAHSDVSINSTPYLFLKLHGHAQPVGEAIGDATVAYRMWVDPRTVVPFPRLERHPDARALAATNRLLERMHWRLSDQALGCAGTAYTESHPAAGSLGAIDDESVQVEFLSAALMSIRESGSTYCGGAHPNNHSDPYVIDIARGEFLDWNRAFDAFVEGEYGIVQPSSMLTDLARHVAADDRYVHPGLKPWLHAEEADAFDTHGDDAIEYAGCGLWPEYLGLSLESPDRLVFNVTGVGHALGVCLGPHASLPFTALEELVEPPHIGSDAKGLLLPSVLPHASLERAGARGQRW